MKVFNGHAKTTSLGLMLKDIFSVNAFRIYHDAEAYGGWEVVKGYDGDSRTGGIEIYAWSQSCYSEVQLKGTH
jgi:hypothetical protein